MKSLNKYPSILSVCFSRNNILCIISSIQGNTLMLSSAGSKKTKGTKKITTSTLYTLSKELYNYSKSKDLLTVYVRVKGINKLRTNFIKYLKILGFNILLIQERFCLPHGGCKKPKIRKL